MSALGISSSIGQVTLKVGPGLTGSASWCLAFKTIAKSSIILSSSMPSTVEDARTPSAASLALVLLPRRPEITARDHATSHGPIAITPSSPLLLHSRHGSSLAPVPPAGLTRSHLVVGTATSLVLHHLLSSSINTVAPLLHVDFLSSSTVHHPITGSSSVAVPSLSLFFFFSIFVWPLQSPSLPSSSSPPPSQTEDHHRPRPMAAPPFKATVEDASALSFQASARRLLSLFSSPFSLCLCPISVHCLDSSHGRQPPPASSSPFIGHPTS